MILKIIKFIILAITFPIWIVPWVIWKIFRKIFYGKEVYCTWCGSKKVKFESGQEGGWTWHYRNKDGSQDKRVADNYQQAGYTSVWNCRICTAVTVGKHFVSESPSKKVNLWKIALQKEGNGEKTSNDWEESSAVDYGKGSHRKGDE